MDPKKKIESGIDCLTSKIPNNKTAIEDLQVTQAVLNLANALATLNNIKEK